MKFAEGGSLSSLLADPARVSELTTTRKLAMASQVTRAIAGLYARANTILCCFGMIWTLPPL
jgi:hypothetical protein